MLVGGIFCNSEKPFDCVKHEVLLCKLEFYGIVGNVHALIKSYLRDSNQRVLTNTKMMYLHTTSDWDRIKHRVPHGSIFGPLLVLLYITDLPKTLKPIIFADDTSNIIIIIIISSSSSSSNPNPINDKKFINIFF